MKSRRRNWKISIALGKRIWSNTLQRFKIDLKERNLFQKTKMTMKKRLQEFQVNYKLYKDSYLATDYSQEKLSSINMENLNLFGIPMGDDEGEGAKNLGET